MSKEYIVDMWINLVHTIRIRAENESQARKAASKLIESGKLYLGDCFSDNLKDSEFFDFELQENTTSFDDAEVFSADEILRKGVRQ